MAQILLIGEDHSLDNKDSLEMGIISSILADSPKNILGVSFELHQAPERKTQGTLYDMVVSMKIPVYLSDVRDPRSIQEESRLVELLGQDPSFENFQAYRETIRRHIDARDDHTSKILASIGGTGVVIHICGRSHLRGLYRSLSGHNVITIQLSKGKPVIRTDGDLTLSITDVIAFGDDYSPSYREMIGASHWPGSYDTSRSHEDFQIDFSSTPYIAYVKTRDAGEPLPHEHLASNLMGLRMALEKELVTSCSIERIKGEKQDFLDSVMANSLGNGTIQVYIYD